MWVDIVWPLGIETDIILRFSDLIWVDIVWPMGSETADIVLILLSGTFYNFLNGYSVSICLTFKILCCWISNKTGIGFRI